MRYAAIILAGGKGSRLGGVRKADMKIGGRRLLDRVLSAVSDCDQRIVVGYEDLQVPPGVLLTREDPPGSGPAAGVAAGMALVEADWVFTLACDLPGVADAVPKLFEATGQAPHHIDAITATARDGVEWLVSVHRAAALRRAIRECPGGVVNGSMRRLYSGLEWETVSTSQTSTKDLDTWEDHTQWQQIEQRAEQT